MQLNNIIGIFYILRITRIIRLVPKYSVLKVIWLAMSDSIGDLVLFMVVLSMTIMMFACFIFYAEQINEIDDNKFDSMPVGLWWAIVTSKLKFI
jgi:hypothetical protein